MNDGWWVLLLFMFMNDNDMVDYIHKQIDEFNMEQLFRKRSVNCSYVEVYNDGRATEYICHHPIRDCPSDWIICNMHECPLYNTEVEMIK